MKTVLIFGLMLFTTSAAMAQEIRTSSETEITDALIGCWEKEATFTVARAERRGELSYYSICFEAAGLVTTAWVGGSAKGGLEGLEDGGTFQVVESKLRLSGERSEGWFFDANELSCDVVIRLGVGMQLQNCIGDAGEVLADSSYSRRGK